MGVLQGSPAAQMDSCFIYLRSQWAAASASAPFLTSPVCFSCRLVTQAARWDAEPRKHLIARRWKYLLLVDYQALTAHSVLLPPPRFVFCFLPQLVVDVWVQTGSVKGSKRTGLQLRENDNRKLTLCALSYCLCQG